MPADFLPPIGATVARDMMSGQVVSYPTRRKYVGWVTVRMADGETGSLVFLRPDHYRVVSPEGRDCLCEGCDHVRDDVQPVFVRYRNFTGHPVPPDSWHLYCRDCRDIVESGRGDWVSHVQRPLIGPPMSPETSLAWEVSHA